MRIIQRAIATVLLLSSSTACTSGDDAGNGATESSLPRYVINARPVLVLEEDGTPEKLFASVLARRLSDGRLVVADQGASTVTVFDRAGEFDRALARRGDGPGELRGDFFLASRADTVFVMGRPLRSRGDVSVFVADRGFLRRFQPASDDAPTGMVLHDRLATGHFLVEQGRGVRVLASAPALGVLHPDSVTFGLLSLDGAGTDRGPVRWLPPVVGAWAHAYPTPAAPIATGTSRYVFAPMTLVRASGDRLWVAEAGSGRLRAYDGTGRQVVDAQLTAEPIAFDQRALDRRRDRELATAASARDSSRVRARYDPNLLPARMPLFDAAHAGIDGELWLRMFEVDVAAAPRYVIVNRAGQEIARATIPAELDVQQIGRDFLLAVRRDSLGVESVHEYALQRR